MLVLQSHVRSQRLITSGDERTKRHHHRHYAQKTFSLSIGIVQTWAITQSPDRLFQIIFVDSDFGGYSRFHAFLSYRIQNDTTRDLLFVCGQNEVWFSFSFSSFLTQVRVGRLANNTLSWILSRNRWRISGAYLLESDDCFVTWKML